MQTGKNQQHTIFRMAAKMIIHPKLGNVSPGFEHTSYANYGISFHHPLVRKKTINNTEKNNPVWRSLRHLMNRKPRFLLPVAAGFGIAALSARFAEPHSSLEICDEVETIFTHFLEELNIERAKNCYAGRV